MPVVRRAGYARPCQAVPRHPGRANHRHRRPERRRRLWHETFGETRWVRSDMPGGPPTPRPPRKTARRFGADGGIHFITFSCYRRRMFFGDAGLRTEFVDRIRVARAKHRFRLLAWVIMPEHVHLMLEPTVHLEEPGSALPAILIGIKKQFATDVLARWRTSGRVVGVPRFWQAGGGFDRNVRDFDELLRETRYIHQNPVTRGLVTCAVDWEWSSARWYAGMDAVLGCDHTAFDRRECPGKNPRVFLGE